MTRSLRAKPSQVLVRMPDEMKTSLLQHAELHDRTLTSEINERLRVSLEGGDRYIASVYGEIREAIMEDVAEAVEANDPAIYRITLKLIKARLEAFQ